MRREIIQDFLNVPGIAGVALMDGLSSPYFRGFELSQQTEFTASQQAILAQSIQQVLETTPEGFNSFEFQFDFYRIYLHKLNQGITLLVLTGNQVSRQVYTQAVRRLLIELQIDQADPIAEFRALALDIPLLPALPLLPFDHLPLRHLPLTLPVHSSQSIHSGQPDSGSPPASPLKPPELNSSTSSPAQSVELTLVPEPLEKPGQLPDRKPEIRKPESDSHVNLKDILAAINGLSQLTTQYLGTMVVSNYWKATRPPVDWLNHFQIERSGQMTFSVQMPSQRLPILTAEQHRCLQAWVLAFIEHCSHVIRNFAKIVRHSLTDQQIALLFGSD
jgi:hypothetical protein